jgi:fructose transport system permease protein
MGCTRPPGWCRPSSSGRSILVFRTGLGQKFFSPFALTLILQQVQIVGVLAAAQSLVILTAGIDLSVGAIAVLSSVVMGQLTFRYGLPRNWPFRRHRLRNIDCALYQRLACRRVKLPPFIVTLGMWQIVLAANYLYSANETIRAQDIEPGAAAAVFGQQDCVWRRASSPMASIFMVCWCFFSPTC